MRYLGIIPARGGSKSIRNKNLVLCGGKQLILYTIEAAKKSSYLAKTIISTDSPEIQKVGKVNGIDVPFLRPSNLAEDHTPIIQVLQHTIRTIAKTDPPFDAIVLLQPTSPLRQAKHIDDAIELFEQSEVDNVVSIIDVPHQFNPYSVYSMENNFLKPFIDNVPLVTRRQDKPKFYARNGPAVLITKTNIIADGKLYGETILGYKMNAEDSIDVDEMEDLHKAEKEILRRDALINNKDV